MPVFRAYWPLATAAALTFVLLSGAAHARGGGHGGSMAHAAKSPAPLSAHAPAASLPTVHPAAAPAGMPEHQHLAVPRPAPPTPPGTTRAATAPAATSAPVSAPATLPIVTGGTSPPPPAPDVTTTPSAIAAPLPELAPIPPLSPQLPTQISGGGTPQANLALSPSSSSGSQSESAPSAPGGGGRTLADCMGFWDRETHMTKPEWKAACLRTLQEYPSVR